MNHKRLAMIAGLCLLLSVVAGACVGISGVATAQPADPNTTNTTNGSANATPAPGPSVPGPPSTANGSNTTPGAGPSTPGGTTSGNGTNMTGNATGNTTGNATGNTSGGGGPLSGVVGAAQGAVNTAQNVAKGALQGAIGTVLQFVVGVPQIDIGWDSGGYHPPDNWPYNSLYSTFYAGFSVPLTLAFFTAIVVMSFGVLPLAAFDVVPGNTTSNASRGIRAAVAIVVGIVSNLLIFSIFHEVVASLATDIAPSPEELTSGMGLAKLAAGGAAGALGLWELGLDIVKWIAILYAVQWLILAFFPMVSMPFFATWIFTPRSGIGRFCGNIMTSYFALLASKIVTAGFLRMAFELDWSANFEGIINAFLSLGMLFCVLLIPPATVVFVLFSKSKVTTVAAGAGAGAVAGSSTLAAKRRIQESERYQGLKESAGEKKEAGKTTATEYGKRGYTNAQGKYWDAKSRIGAAKTASMGNPLQAGKQRVQDIRSPSSSSSSSQSGSGTGTDGTGPVSDGGREKTSAQQIRDLEEPSVSTDRLPAEQRKQYSKTKSNQQDITSNRE